MERKSEERIHLLDMIRGFCIICMIFFHAFFDFAYIFDFSFGKALISFFEPSVPFFVAVFILISGISCNLSKNNLKRGAVLFFIAMAITYITSFDSSLVVMFGILHLLSICMMLYALLEKLLAKIHFWVGMPILTVLYIIFIPIQNHAIGVEGVFLYHLPKAVTENSLLFPFGIYDPFFSSSDYAPVFPLIFIFFAGTLLGRYLHRLPDFAYKNYIKPLSFAGRNTLIIYLAHQPVLVAVIYLTDFFK